MSKKNKKKDKSTRKFEAFYIFLRVVGFILPLIAYLILTIAIFPAPNSGLTVLCILGAILVGIGLVNVVGLIDGYHFGYFFTLLFMGVGAVFISVGAILMYVPSIYSALDEKTITKYFIVWITLAVMAIMYFFARRGIIYILRSKKISQTTIKSLMHGKKKFWWYEAIHEQYEMGSVYWINKVFTGAYAIILLIQTTIGWWKPLVDAVAFGTALLCFLFSALFWQACSPQIADKKEHLSIESAVVIPVFYILNGIAIIVYSVA